LAPASISVGNNAEFPMLRSMNQRVRADSSNSFPKGMSMTPAVSMTSGGVPSGFLPR
jgi:hypothetical protein